MNNVNLASYADDNTPYVKGDGVIQVTECKPCQVSLDNK